MCYKILTFNHSSEGYQYLYQRAGIVFFRRPPENGTPVPKHEETLYFYELYCTNFILLYFINNVCWLICSLYEYVRY
jgi:hypothetical protein